MGLFGNRKEHGAREHPPDVSSPIAQALPKRSNSRMPRIGNLFSDSGEGNSPNALADTAMSGDEPQAPTIDMDEIDTSATVIVKEVSPVPATSVGVQDDARKFSPLQPSPRRNENRERAVSRQDAIMRRANSISRMANRDSIKRSVSRKIARSESRQQNFRRSCSRDNNCSDREEIPGIPSQSFDDSEEEVEKTGVGSSSSRCMSMLTQSMEDAQIGTPKAKDNQDFETAYGEDDIFLLEEATRNDFCEMKIIGSRASVKEENIDAEESRVEHSKGINSEVVLREDKANEASQSHGQKPAKARRRPPPLISTDCEKSSGDPSSDWPHTTEFGKDGGFVTGGFKITADGMVGTPELVTREDSIDGEVPQSDRNLLLVRSLKEIRPGPTIGAGAAGRVYLAEHLPSKRTLAMKVVNVYDKEKRNQLLKELATLCTYTSRNLVRFYGAFYDGSGAVHIALEYMDHGCLATFIQRVGPIPERVVQMIAIDCLRGLRFLHRNHVLHRDFKTANILLSRRLCCAKISDFGLARDLDEGVSRVETFVGTVAYMSPERLQGSKYTYASDIWAVGVSLVECLLGRYPFDRPQNYFDYIEATMTADMWKNFDKSKVKVSSAARDFVALCTHTEPKHRPDADQLLRHPWIANMRRDSELYGSWLDHCRIISMKVPRK